MNSAPVLFTGSHVTAWVYEGDSSHTGILVASLVSGSSDADGDPLGIAITALDTHLGAWQYSTDGGATWLTIHADLINSSTNELALLLEPTARVRLLPYADLNGAALNCMTFRAWDGTSGAQGQYAVIAGSGGDTAFSSNTSLSSYLVGRVNDAPTFAAGTGKVAIPVSGSDVGSSAAVQADGKTVVGGYTFDGSSYVFAVVRLNADGTLDMGFNGTGKITIPFAGHDLGYGLTMQPDGKILVAGYASNAGNADFAVVRLNADGSIDTGFNGSGKATIPVGVSQDFAYSITTQLDGKILLAGSAIGASSNDIAVVRLNADGSLDSGFNGSGKVTIALGDSNDSAHSITTQPDGKILVAGSTLIGGANDFAVVRLNADGSLDTGFNGTGKVSIPVSGSLDVGYAITIQPDGKILMAGYASFGGNSEFAVVRLNGDGTLDTGFNGTGKVIIPMGTGRDVGRGIAIQPDGKILVAGHTDIGGSDDFAVLRLNADGTLDAGFNGTGKVTVSLGTSSDVGYSIAIQPDGKIVVAGRAWNGTDHDFAVARLNADGTLDPTFNGTAASTLGGTASYLAGAAPVALDSSVAIYDVELAAANNYAGASITLARAGGADASDVFSARGNLSFSGGNAVLSGVTIGTVSNGAGTLVITFNGNATQARVNEALSSIGYANSSGAPPASVQIGWTFSDGNSGAQGDGGALVATGATTVNITTRPAVTGVSSSTADGAHKAGEVIVIQVSFDRPVTVTGTPQLTLETGAVDRVASYVGGSGTNTLSFSYTVQAGDASGDLDYTGPGALALNGGSIRDLAGNDATLTLPAPGAPGSLAANKALVIDASAPVFASGVVGGQSAVLIYADASALDGVNLPAPGAFAVTVDGAAVGVTQVSVNAASRTVVLTLDSWVMPAASVTVAYTDPSAGDDANAIQDVAGNDAGSSGIAVLENRSVLPDNPAPNPAPTPNPNPNPAPETPRGVTKTAPAGGGEVRGTPYDDELRGQGGNDSFYPGGGKDSVNGGDGLDEVVFTGPRRSYAVSHTQEGYLVRSLADPNERVTLAQVERLKFADLSINLEVGEAAKGLAPSLIDSLVELYIGYVGRVPDADGMAYWMDRLIEGASLAEVGQGFYAAAVHHSTLTGYSANMSDGAFVERVYRHVLGRNDADAEGLAFWTAKLADGSATRGTLVGQMLESAHSFKGHATYGYVADLLDNKIEVGKAFALSMGLVFNRPEDSITEGMRIAQAVTPTDADTAISLIGVADGFSLY